MPLQGANQRPRKAGGAPGNRPIFLTVEPCAGQTIEGLVASVAIGDWGQLDQRETGYRRDVVTPFVEHQLTEAGDVHLYAVESRNHKKSDEKTPILLSYLDVVVQGYLREFGREGVTRFFQTTDGWDTPIKDDRATPYYPRHQKLSKEELRLTDDWLLEFSANVLPLQDP